MTGIKETISELLIMTSKSKSIGATDGALVYCRQSMECILEDQYVQYFEEKPKPPKHGVSRFFWTCQKLKSKINESLYSTFHELNKLSRQGAHFSGNKNSENTIDEAMNLVRILYDGFYPENPLEENIIVDEVLVRQRVLESESNELLRLNFDDQIIDDMELVIDGYAELALLSLEQGENISLQERASLGIALYHSGAVKDAMKIFNSTSVQIMDNKSPEILALCYSGLGRICRQRGDIEEALANYNKSLENYRVCDNDEGEMMVLCNIGDIHRKLGDIEKAKKLFDQSLLIARKSNHKRGESSVLSSIADLERNQGNLVEAEQLYRESLQLAKDTNYIQRISTNYGGLAEIERRRGNEENAEKSLRQNLIFTRNQGYRRGEAINLGELGKIYRRKGDFQKARNFYGKSLKINREIEDLMGVATCLGSLAWISRKQKKYDRASSLYNEALELSKQSDDQKGIAINLAELARISSDLEDHNLLSAEEYKKLID